jgi:hypothetical protein
MIDTSEAGVLRVSSPRLVDQILKEWEITSGSEFPAQYNLYDEVDSPKLSAHWKERFHSGVMAMLYIAKRGPRPDILLPINYLSSKVLEPTESHMKKFLKVLRYLYHTKYLVMRLYVGEDRRLKLYVDASYGVHMKGHSHTGVVLKYGDATIETKSLKQKIVVKSSCEAELIAASDEAGQLIHMREFLRHQGYEAEMESPGVLFQDNQAAIKLQVNGKSSSNRTKHIHIRNFWLKDQVAQGNIVIEYKCTNDMLADLLTKPLQGELFYKFRKLIMNEL